MKSIENYFKTFDQTEMFYETWSPDNPLATLVITHGLAEHAGCYSNFSKETLKENFRTIAWDLRGHGKSGGKRGYVSDFNDFIKDHLCFLQHLQENNSIKGPLILFGHSMGGLITLKSLLVNSQLDPKAVCLSSPALGVAMDVPQIKEKAAKLAAQWIPKITMFNEIDHKDLSRDQELLATYPKDPLRHDKISPRLFLGMQESFSFVFEHIQDFKHPVLFQLSGQDKLVSTEESKRAFDLLTCKKEIHVYPDSYHEIFNDLDRMQCFKDLVHFIKENTDEN